MSLAGLTIAITASRRARELAHLIASRGGTGYLAPTVGIATRPDIGEEAEAFILEVVEQGADYAVFMTGPGVYSLMSAARSQGTEAKLLAALGKVTIVARSSKPKKALAEHGVETDIVPDDNTAEGIAKVLKGHDLSGKRIAVLWHGSYSPRLKEELEPAGALVFESSTYAYSLDLAESGARILGEMGFDYVPPDRGKVLQLIEDLSRGRLDAITFTSPPSVRNLFQIAEAHHVRESLQRSLNERIIVVAVGPPTGKALAENGVHADVMPEVYKMGPMVMALEDYVSRPQSPKPTATSPGPTAEANPRA